MSRGYRQVGLTLDGETIVLQKFHGKFSKPSYATEAWLEQNQALLKTGVGLDLETTGLDKNIDQVIEIAVRPFQYRTDTGEILAVDGGYTGLQDPGSPLSEVVKKVTGIDDELLKGQSIDWQHVARILEKSDLVIAHNAKFDRPFMDLLLPVSKAKLWACSWRQVDWSAKGFPVQRLDVLSLYHGFFVDAHRAVNDVNAMLCLLNCPDAETGRPYLQELLKECILARTVIFANGSPFESKDLLRTRGYRWDTEERTWHRSVPEHAASDEILWLEANVYLGRFRGRTQSIPCIENFTSGD